MNLVPAIGEVNGDRQDFRYSVWSEEPFRQYGMCQTSVDFKTRRIQPRKEVRGRIARVQFYMADRYQLALSKQDTRIFCAWAKAYPIDQWERQRNERIRQWQGSANPFVDQPERAAQHCARESSMAAP